MFKRMSVLVRRPGDDRAFFSRAWERHALPVSDLPKVRGYIQNHIEEEFFTEGGAPLKVDGFVELLWDSPEDMTAAFASLAAQPMVEDEPNFLGHGSGYALAAAPALREAQGGKLILVAVGLDNAALSALELRLSRSPGLVHMIRDDVTALIGKPGMAPPQPVDAFFHLYFPHEGAAGGAARLALSAATPGQVGAYRVRTIRFA